MARDVLADAATRLIDNVTEGVGFVRERTIEIGARVIWVDNIGSLVIVKGQANYTLLVIGAVLVLAGLVTLQSDIGMALLLIGAGVALAAFNLNQKIHNGLSIGTVDGRSTLIVSTDENFLLRTLEFLREKIDTGNITLQGTFDIGATRVSSGGGGIVIGDDGLAGGRGAKVEAPTPPPSPQWAEPQPPTEAAASYAPAPEPEAAAASYAPLPRQHSAPLSVDYYESAADEPRKPRAAAFFIAAVLAAALGAGGFFWWRQSQAEAAQAAWDAVSKTDVASLRAYLADDPRDYRDDAEAVLANLERNTYDSAQRSDTIAAYERFLSQFPESSHAIAARGRIAELRIREQFANTAPTLISPEDGALFDHFPRETVLTWAPVANAASYQVEVQMYDPGSNRWVDDSGAVLQADVFGVESYSFSFVGAQPGRWRVRAVDPEGHYGSFSDWRVFTYSR